MTAETTAGPVTPSQTIGPFYGFALPFADGARIVAAGHPGAVTVHGHVRDGTGQPIPDALLEFWQAAPDGSTTGAPGSLRRDPVNGAVLGRDHLTFTGFARVPTDADGHYAVLTVPPGPVGRSAPYLAVCLFARGLTHHLYTRVYFADAAEANETDPLLASLPPDRRATLVSVLERPSVHRFDVRLQQGGDDDAETVFLEFSG